MGGMWVCTVRGIKDYIGVGSRPEWAYANWKCWSKYGPR